MGGRASRQKLPSRKWAERKFWPRVDKRGPKVLETRCWLWTGPVFKSGGHGQVSIPGMTSKIAHRVRFALKYGRWPDGLLCHKCDNPRCVRLGHLYEGSPLSNMRDKWDRGRGARLVGESNPSAKLTQVEVIEIIRLRNEEGLLLREIGDLFGVGFKAISKIVTGKRWRHGR